MTLDEKTPLALRRFEELGEAPRTEAFLVR